MQEKLMMLGFGVACILIGVLLLKSHGKGKKKFYSKICPHCRAKIDVEADVCPYCRGRQGTFSGVSRAGFAKTNNWGKLIAGLLLLAIGVVLVASVFGIDLLS